MARSKRVVPGEEAIDHPERVSGLVLVGGFAAFGRNPACIKFGRITLMPLTDPLDPAFVREFQESTLTHPLPEVAMSRIVAEGLQAPAWVWKAAWAGLLETDLTPGLARIKAPTLLVWGVIGMIWRFGASRASSDAPFRKCALRFSWIPAMHHIGRSRSASPTLSLTSWTD